MNYNFFKDITLRSIFSGLLILSLFVPSMLPILAQEEELPTNDGPSTVNDDLFGDDGDTSVPNIDDDDLPSLDGLEGEDYPFDESGNYIGERTANPVPYKSYGEPIAPEGDIITGTVGGFFECSITSILANAISTAIQNAIVQALGFIFNMEVPTVDSKIRFKEGGYYLFGFIPIIPSWDSFMVCMVNKTVALLTDATIYWIRSGFEGNPAFVQNPERFFRQVADFEYENFLEGVAAEMACDPFRIQVVNTLARSHNLRFEQYGRCNMFDMDGNVDGFLRGDFFDYDMWFNYTQNPANNPAGSALLLQGEMERRISVAQNNIMIELDWGKGYLSWKDEEGNTVSPGNMIQAQLEQTLNISKGRLTVADEFDEVINELVNYLIKWALDETMGALRGAI